MTQQSRGRLFVVEGLDRSGKSTQCDLLVDSLKPCALLKFPNRTTYIGTMIDRYLKSEALLDDRCIHLLFSANRWEEAKRILSLLAEGTNVVLDRYTYSGIAYSVVKGLDRNWCRASDIGLPSPDMIFFLDVSEKIAADRGGFGLERYEVASTQRAVRQEFQTLFRGNDRVRLVDAGQTINEVQAEIWVHVQAELARPVEAMVDAIA